MNKQDLVTAVAKQLGVSKAKAAQIAELFFSPSGILASELKRGGKVGISGFGTFETRRRAAREFRDPRTGRSSDIEAAVVPAFRASQTLRDLVNRKR